MYTYYSHWDGWLNVGKVVDFYERLIGRAITVDQVVSALSAEFGHNDMDYLAGDAECIYHADLTCESSLSLGDLNTPYFKYVRPGRAGYGSRSTGQIGDLYMIVDRTNNIFYPNIIGASVTLGRAYQSPPDDEPLAAAAMVEGFILEEEEEE